MVLPLQQILKKQQQHQHLQQEQQFEDLPSVSGLLPPSDLNILDWLASKSKLRHKKGIAAEESPAGADSSKKPPVVKSVDGDVFQYIEDSLDLINNDLETLDSVSTLQVSLPSQGGEREDLITNDIIYYDHELPAEKAQESEEKKIAEPTRSPATVEVTTRAGELVTDEQINNVMDHNNKLAVILKNTLEMQAFLFHKLFKYIF